MRVGVRLFDYPAALDAWMAGGGVPQRFSDQCVVELLRLGLAQRHVELVQALCAVEDYSDPDSHARRRASLHDGASDRGLKVAVGKRPEARRQAFVRDLASLFDDLNIETSLTVLRCIAREIGLMVEDLESGKEDGDPRNELRRQPKLEDHLLSALTALTWWVVVHRPDLMAAASSAEYPPSTEA